MVKDVTKKIFHDGSDRRRTAESKALARHDAKALSGKPIPKTLTLAEVKTSLHGTPYHREAGDVTHRFGLENSDDLALHMTDKMLTAKDKAVVADIHRAHAEDPRNIPLLSKKQIKRALKAMGILPTSNDHEQLVHSLLRAIGKGSVSGGAVTLHEQSNGMSGRAECAVDMTKQTLAEALDELKPLPPMRYEESEIATIGKTNPARLRMSMTANDNLIIANLSAQMAVKAGGAKVYLIFKRRPAQTHANDGGELGGKWSPTVANPTYTIPDGVVIPPGGILQIFCGHRGKKHRGIASDVPHPWQKLFWSEDNYFKNSWAISLHDRSGSRNQMVSRHVLLKRGTEDVKEAKRTLKQKELGAADTPYKVLEEFSEEVKKAYNKDKEFWSEEHASEGYGQEEAEWLPHPDYTHQVAGLKSIAQRYSAASIREETSTPLQHPASQGIIPQMNMTGHETVTASRQTYGNA